MLVSGHLHQKSISTYSKLSIVTLISFKFIEIFIGSLIFPIIEPGCCWAGCFHCQSCSTLVCAGGRKGGNLKQIEIFFPTDCPSKKTGKKWEATLNRFKKNFHTDCRQPAVGSGSGGWSRRRSALGVLFGPNTFNSCKTKKLCFLFGHVLQPSCRGRLSLAKC